MEVHLPWFGSFLCAVLVHVYLCVSVKCSSPPVPVPVPVPPTLHTPLLAPSSAPLSSIYPAEFFTQHQQFIPSFELMANAIIHTLTSHNIATGEQLQSERQSFVDVGCGHGLLVEALRKVGITHIQGVEGSQAAQQMWPSVYSSYYHMMDLTVPGISLPPTRIVSSFEVAEHLPSTSSSVFISLLTQHHPDAVIFAAATECQDLAQNPTHVNEQGYEYWQQHFQQHGYEIDALATATLWDELCRVDRIPISEQLWWYPKNTLIFRPTSILSTPSYLVRLSSHNLSFHRPPCLKAHDHSSCNALGIMLQRDHQERQVLLMKLQIQALQQRLIQLTTTDNTQHMTHEEL